MRRVLGFDAGPFWDTERDWVSDEKGAHNLYWNDMRITGGKGARVAFDPVGGPDFAKLIAALGFGGLVYLYGALSSEPTTLPVLDMIGKMPTIKAHNIWGTSGDEAGSSSRVGTPNPPMNPIA